MNPVAESKKMPIMIFTSILTFLKWELSSWTGPKWKQNFTKEYTKDKTNTCPFYNLMLLFEQNPGAKIKKMSV